MNKEYARSYSVLGLQPGSSWSEIRDAYKNLVKKWHPDHFQQDNKRRKIAEERTMEITRAYKALAEYHQKHGSTPTAPSPERTPETTATPKSTGRPATAASEPAADTHADISAPIQAKTTHWKTFFVLTAIFLLFYVWFLDAPVEQDYTPGALPKSAAPGLPQSDVGDKATRQATDRYFTIGSRPGEVYAIQGIPSKTENGIWHYGKSRVYFINGGVSHWEIHPDSPLNASLDVEAQSTEKDFIQRGSTKAEVRALQGTPWLQTEREWTYGSSRIFFSGDVVTGWEESAINPLKIQR